MNNMCKAVLFFMPLFFLFFLIISCKTQPFVSQENDDTVHIIFIGIDGWTASSILHADMPVIERFMREGSYSRFVSSEMPTNSPTNWASLFMGVGPDVHHLTDESDLKPAYPPQQTIFSLLKERKPDSVIGAFYEWLAIKYLFEKNVLERSQHLPRMWDITVDAIVSPYIKSKKPTFLYIHIDAVDHAGHTKGFDTPEYYKALEKYDKRIGKIEEAVKKAGIYDNTIFIVGTDHGGKGTHHGSDSPEERLVPYIFYGKNIKQGHEIQKQDIKITDITATIAFLFGLEQPDNWLGTPICEIKNP